MNSGRIYVRVISEIMNTLISVANELNSREKEKERKKERERERDMQS